MIRVLAVGLLTASGAAAAVSVDEQADLVERAKKHIVIDFKDPYSAQFEGVFIGEAANGDPVVCGTVNAKNSYGAYTGRKRFYYLEAGKVYSNIETGDNFFSALYEPFCGK